MVAVCSTWCAAARVSAPAPLSSEAIARHAASLRDRGFTVLPSPVIDPSLIARLAATTTARLDSLLDQVEAKGCDPLEQQYLFREICARQSMRWDLQISRDDDDGSMGPPNDGADDAYAELSRVLLSSAIEPIVEALQGAAYEGVRPTACGAVVSRRGAAAQRPHADANLPHYAEATQRRHSVMVPLLASPAHAAARRSSSRPTSACPGAHGRPRRVGAGGRLRRPPCRMAGRLPNQSPPTQDKVADSAAARPARRSASRRTGSSTASSH